MFYSITAGGNFGCREAIYKLVEKVLVIRDEGDHDNLVGNDLAADFEGLTEEQVKRKIEALNAQGSGHSYDGCHACTWSISFCQLDDDQVPAHLIYNEPNESFVIREALRIARDLPKTMVSDKILEDFEEISGLDSTGKSIYKAIANGDGYRIGDQITIYSYPKILGKLLCIFGAGTTLIGNIFLDELSW